MRVALVLLVAVGALALARAQQQQGEQGAPAAATLYPCPAWCPASGGPPVCAEDEDGKLYQFQNGCWFRKCGCRIRLTPVRFTKCPANAPSCPLDGPQARDAADISIGSDSDEAQSDPSSLSDSLEQPEQQQQQFAESLADAHLGGNRIRNSRRQR